MVMGVHELRSVLIYVYRAVYSICIETLPSSLSFRAGSSIGRSLIMTSKVLLSNIKLTSLLTMVYSKIL